MRIAPSEKPIVRAAPPVPEPRASFASLLGEATPSGGDAVSTAPGIRSEPVGPDVPDTVAATFDAFGMFGRRAETTPMEATPVLWAGDTPLGAVASTSGPEAVVSQAALAPASSNHAITPGAVLEGGARRDPTQPSRRPARDDVLSVTEGAADPEAAVTDHDDVAPGAVRRRTAQKPAETETGARLTLSDAAEAAGLTVRLAGLSAEEAAQFRARARSLLGEHGLRLDKLDINGQDRSGGDLPTQGITQWR